MYLLRVRNKRKLRHFYRSIYILSVHHTFIYLWEVYLGCDIEILQMQRCSELLQAGILVLLTWLFRSQFWKTHLVLYGTKHTSKCGRCGGLRGLDIRCFLYPVSSSWWFEQVNGTAELSPVSASGFQVPGALLACIKHSTEQMEVKHLLQ